MAVKNRLCLSVTVLMLDTKGWLQYSVIVTLPGLSIKFIGA